MLLFRARAFGASQRAACFLLAATTFCGATGSSAWASDAAERQGDISSDGAVVVAAAASEAGKSHAHGAQATNRIPTRFVIGLEHETKFQVFALRNPNRVIVDLPDVKVRLPRQADGKAMGLVSGFRGGLASAGKMRVVIDVTYPVVVDDARIEHDRQGKATNLVLDIVPFDAVKRTNRQPFASATMAKAGLKSIQPPLPRPAERPEHRAARAYKPVIVLDPGHGGHDSGAVRNGTVEKEVVLLFAQTLRKKLTDAGRYKVLMTRDRDTFIPLDERRDFAERHKAALFIAIHADYAGSSARGATIYSLRDSVADSLKRTAKGEVVRSVLKDHEIRALPSGEADKGAVQGILADLAQSEVQMTSTRTSVFARSVIEYMGNTTNMMDNPDRSAAFRVLKTAKVPAVLIELAYVSNKQDAAQLKSESWRKKVSDSIATAVDNYFAHQIARIPM